MKLSKAQRDVLSKLRAGGHLPFPDLRFWVNGRFVGRRVNIVTLCVLERLDLVKRVNHKSYGPNWRKTGEVYTSIKVVLTAAGKRKATDE